MDNERHFREKCPVQLGEIVDPAPRQPPRVSLEPDGKGDDNGQDLADHRYVERVRV
ncbi:hypothetical protein CS0771_60750 [Catellatospora sp. IY07-71]|nr:hypothetical protein CS0771_60750 [Catellatospora sp. IY07-71]